MSVDHVQSLFLSSRGNAALFRPVDGAGCPDDDVSTIERRILAYELLLDRGLIRIFVKLPTSPILQFAVTGVADPQHCNTDSAHGLTSYGPGVTSAGVVSVYRRPLPSTNLPLLGSFMWDGRETSLQQQAIDATRVHAQTPSPLTTAAAAQELAFENGQFTAQSSDRLAGALDAFGGQGGPATLAALNSSFYVGINDPFGLNPTGTVATSSAMTLSAAWKSLLPPAPDMIVGDIPDVELPWVNRTEARASIERGERLFDGRRFTIGGVRGLNDGLAPASFSGTCSSCHDSPDTGGHSAHTLMDVGESIPDAPRSPASAPTSAR